MLFKAAVAVAAGRVTLAFRHWTRPERTDGRHAADGALAIEAVVPRLPPVAVRARCLRPLRTGDPPALARSAASRSASLVLTG
jgi:hypothetical protein